LFHSGFGFADEADEVEKSCFNINKSELIDKAQIKTLLEFVKLTRYPKLFSFCNSLPHEAGLNHRCGVLRPLAPLHCLTIETKTTLELR
jgi:hypothetical protein